MRLLLLLAAVLPGLFWEQGPETAAALKRAGIDRLYVPPAKAAAWRDTGLNPESLDEAALRKFDKLRSPGVRSNIASATATPWVDANGWRFERNPKALYWYDAAPRAGPLAAAEAFAYAVDAVVRIDPADLEPFGRMLAFLRQVDAPAMPALANIGVIDDGSALLGEVLNLLARRNLLFRIVPAPDAKLAVTVRLGSPQFPRESARNPGQFAQQVRQQLTDEQRLLRIYGSETVLGRLTGNGPRARLHLLNYGRRKVFSLRVRVLGVYRTAKVQAEGVESTAAADYALEPHATEFTIPEMGTYAVVDLE